MPAIPCPLRVLAMIPNPADATAFNVEAAWQSLLDGTETSRMTGTIDLVRLEMPTEAGLERALGETPAHVLHFIGHGGSRGGGYSSLVFEGREKRSRAVTAQHLGALLKTYEQTRLVVLQACHEPQDVLAEIATTLIEEGVPAAVSTGQCSDAISIGAFYIYLTRGDPIPNAASELGSDVHWALRQDLADGHVFSAPGAVAPQPATSIPNAPATPDPQKAAAEAGERARKRAAAETERDLERRRAAGRFDVFLCHNKSDKPAVKRIGRQLMERNILPWLDEWELRPGMAWQRLLEEQIGGIGAAAVFVGSNGIGPWQRQELDTLLRQFVTRACPVIPVLLPTAPSEPRLPLFLEGMTWVDFRCIDPDPLDRFVWGITGKRSVLK